MKRDHYYKYPTDEERLEKRPQDVPLEDFKLLLKYWGDPSIKVYTYNFKLASFSASLMFNQFRMTN